MSNNKPLIKLISAFCAWYENDSHSKNKDFYSNSITEENLENLDESSFKEFFIEFVREGGKVQTGGSRNLNDFINTLNERYPEFKNYTLQPFKTKFNLKEWFEQLDHFTGFGFGIATIYLNRVDPDTYPVLNNKTINALNKLGYQISSTQNLTNYKKVSKYQGELINAYSQLDDYYKADALTHFIVSVPEGKALIATYLQNSDIDDAMEQVEIDFKVQDSNDKNEVLDKIRSCENDKSEEVTVQGKTYKRNTYLFSLIKKLRGYTCQFCSTILPVGDGKYYIEACHIKSKAEGGKDKLNNILILCPNCHKLFDYCDRNNVKHKDDEYSVTLNGDSYEADLSY